jgi:hypothetical protein
VQDFLEQREDCHVGALDVAVVMTTVLPAFVELRIYYGSEDPEGRSGWCIASEALPLSSYSFA